MVCTGVSLIDLECFKMYFKLSLQIQKNAPEYGAGINPISRLIQIQQAKKEKEPVYTLVTERGLPRRREFVIQVFIQTSEFQETSRSSAVTRCCKFTLNIAHVD